MAGALSIKILQISQRPADCLQPKYWQDIPRKKQDTIFMILYYRITIPYEN
jgi:hypothetical protein